MFIPIMSTEYSVQILEIEFFLKFTGWTITLKNNTIVEKTKPFNFINIQQNNVPSPTKINWNDIPSKKQKELTIIINNTKKSFK